MAEKQRTISQQVSFTGKGLHTGKVTTTTVYPAEPNTGIRFQRIDLENKPIIPANPEYVVDTSRGTVIGISREVFVSTIEHLMASLHALHVNNALIEVDGPEVPILNGSAKPFYDKIESVGTTEQEADLEYLEIKEKTVYLEPERGVEIIAYPCDTFRLDVKISYDSFMLRNQFASLTDLKDFGKEIACCKTFCFFREIEMMLAANLIKGGDLDNAIVFVDRKVTPEEIARMSQLFPGKEINIEKEGVLNNTQLSFENEPARHKLLDLIGDLWLVGKPIKAHIIATIPGHKANTEFAKILRKQINNQTEMTQQSLAYIHPDAKLGKNVVVKPFSYIYDDVEIGDGTIIESNVTIMPGARIGKNVHIFPGAVISAIPQDLKFAGEHTTTEIGDNTVIRECVTIHRGTVDKMTTKVGKNCLLMGYVHIAHDCIVGDNCIFANYAALSGHCVIGDFVIIEGKAGAQQFMHVGDHAFIGAGTFIRKNVPPFVKAAEEPIQYIGINSVGLSRRGFSEDKIREIQDIYRLIFLQKGVLMKDALEMVRTQIPQSAERDMILDFITNSANGIIKKP